MVTFPRRAQDQELGVLGSGERNRDTVAGVFGGQAGVIIEEVLDSSSLAELEHIGKQLGVGGCTGDSEAAMEIYRGVIRYVAKLKGIYEMRSLMEVACDALGRDQ